MDDNPDNAEDSIEQFKSVVESATVEDVDEPTGRKDVSIAYQASYGFEVESGEAVGVYYEPHRGDPETIHIDWSDNDRTSVHIDDIAILDEGEYYTPE